MSAAKRLSFKIPLQSEIQSYIKEKKGWPEAFCIYYAERFWNNYQAAGWKLSNGNAMKDWKAAFNSQWQLLKFKEDIDRLQAMGGKAEPAKVIHMMKEPERALNSDIERLDKLLVLYSQGPTKYTIDILATKWPVEALNACYEIIKRERLWDPTINKQDLQRIADERRLKATVIIRTLDYIGVRGFSFSALRKTRKNE